MPEKMFFVEIVLGEEVPQGSKLLTVLMTQGGPCGIYEVPKTGHDHLQAERKKRRLENEKKLIKLNY